MKKIKNCYAISDIVPLLNINKLTSNCSYEHGILEDFHSMIFQQKPYLRYMKNVVLFATRKIQLGFNHLDN